MQNAKVKFLYSENKRGDVLEDKIRYGIIGVHKQFREKEQAIAYAKFLKLPDNSVYLILPPDMTQKMIDNEN